MRGEQLIQARLFKDEGETSVKVLQRKTFPQRFFFVLQIHNFMPNWPTCTPVPAFRPQLSAFSECLAPIKGTCSPDYIASEFTVE
jgi:hypothetical protein